MKYQIIDGDLCTKKEVVSNALEVIFYDDDGKYLGKVRPWQFREHKEHLDVIGTKRLRIGVLSYENEPIDTNWVSFGPQSSAPKVIK